jgi:hypothetical protein
MVQISNLVCMVIMMLSRVSRCRSWSMLASSSSLTRRVHPRRSQFYLSSSSALQMSSTASASDRSAMSKSRAPFRMPKDSPDDSKATTKSASSGAVKPLTWHPLGLLTEIADCLENELKLKAPTPVQSLVIPELLKEEKESLAFLAATGSGKTLAYLLPLVQQLKQQEMFENFERRP